MFHKLVLAVLTLVSVAFAQECAARVVDCSVAECSGGDVCCDNVCVDGDLAIGESCGESVCGECSYPGLCMGGVCTLISLPDGCGCTVDDDCDDLCEGGTCVGDELDVGQVCAVDRQCESGRCLEGVCDGFALDEPCSTSFLSLPKVQCQTGLFCSSLVESCQPQVLTGPCDPAEEDIMQCDDGVCVDNVCVGSGTLPNLAACDAVNTYYANPCQEGLYCYNGTCRSEAAEGASCVVDEQCQVHGETPISMSCETGVCVSNQGDACETDDDCGTGHCDCLDDGTQQCTSSEPFYLLFGVYKQSRCRGQNAAAEAAGVSFATVDVLSLAQPQQTAYANLHCCVLCALEADDPTSLFYRAQLSVTVDCASATVTAKATSCEASVLPPPVVTNCGSFGTSTGTTSGSTTSGTGGSTSASGTSATASTASGTGGSTATGTSASGTSATATGTSTSGSATTGATSAGTRPGLVFGGLLAALLLPLV